LKTTPFKAANKESVRLQAGGAQTCLPPSRDKNGGRYAWKPGHGPSDIEPAEMPTWLVEVMSVESRTDSKPKSTFSRPTSGGNDRDLALAAVAGLNPERADNYDSWLQVGMILHGIDQGEEMLTAWEEWSTTSAKWKDGECGRKWESFHAEKQNGVGIGTLITWAKQDGWRHPGRNGKAEQPANETGGIRPPSAFTNFHEVEV